MDLTDLESQDELVEELVIYYGSTNIHIENIICPYCYAENDIRFRALDKPLICVHCETPLFPF